MVMTGGELASRKTGSFNLREEAARATLRFIRLRGHQYVELREDGKRLIFFCTLCLTRCYSDSAIFDHLDGNLHAKRYSAAKLTLFGSLPWPFNDGVLFFFDSSEKEKLSLLNAKYNTVEPLLNVSDKHHNSNSINDENLELILYGRDKSLNSNGDISSLNLNGPDGNENELEQKGVDSLHLVVPEVLLKDELSMLRIRLVGFGHIACRLNETDEIRNRIRKIWCAWLGYGDSDEDEPEVGSMLSVPECDFSVITFPYSYSLGRKGVMEDINALLSSSPCREQEELTSISKKRKKRQNEASNDLKTGSTDSELCPQMGEADNSLISSRCEDQLQPARSITSKAARKELRKRQRLASERLCGVCQQRMLPGKDVATLLNRKTGNLACRSRNKNGAFHVFHTSCLIHWLLLCEAEIWIGQFNCVNTTLESLPMPDSNGTFSGRKTVNGETDSTTCMSSIFCPECQGTGLNIEDELEGPRVSLSEMFLHYIKVAESHKAWMDDPEVLSKCSTGLHFCTGSEDNFQEVLPLKLLQFYQAVE